MISYGRGEDRFLLFFPFAYSVHTPPGCIGLVPKEHGLGLLLNRRGDRGCTSRTQRLSRYGCLGGETWLLAQEDEVEKACLALERRDIARWKKIFKEAKKDQG
jgi:hypothetical protein